jgi:predicted transglutaminase-like cysteine proteinase
MMKQGLIAAIAMLLISMPTAHAAGPVGLARELKTAPTVRYIIEKRRVMAPFAFVTFCVRNPGQCTPADGASVVALDRVNARQLRDVNISVNKAIQPVNEVADDLDADVWNVNVTSGDCEDFALTKRDKLISLGWPARALRIAVARTSWGEGHAVLVVKTDRGDLVLDNRTNVIKDWRSADLQWTMIQSADSPKVWYAL